MSKKVMFSQPIAGLSDQQIVETREKAVGFLEGQGYSVVNTLFTDKWYSKESMQERGVVQIPLCFLAKSLESMSLCHAVYFAKGWENARGCKIEHDVAKAYGLEIIYEEYVVVMEGTKAAREQNVKAIKQCRVGLDEQLQIVKNLPGSHEVSLSVTNLQQSIMWLGMDLKRLNETNPYPDSYKPENIKIAPTADGLKM